MEHIITGTNPILIPVIFFKNSFNFLILIIQIHILKYLYLTYLFLKTKNAIKDISMPHKACTATPAPIKSEWYALKDAPEPCTLVISFKTSSDNNTVNIKL